VDARVGGSLRIVMRAPDGTEYPMIGVFREVVAPERLVFTNMPWTRRASRSWMRLTTVTFAEHGGGTKLTVHTARGGAGAPGGADARGDGSGLGPDPGSPRGPCGADGGGR